MVDKRADIDVQEGGSWAKGVANTLGRGVSALMGTPLISPQLLANADPGRVKQLAQQMAKVAPELQNVHVNVGGANPWTEMQRAWNSPYATPVGRVVGAISSPLQAMMANVRRGDMYNPSANSVTVYSKPEAILQHELGHAIDFNRMAGKGSLLGRAGREAYGMTAANPFARLLPEARANTRSEEAIGKFLSQDDYNKAMSERWKVLAPAYSTYGGSAALAGMNIRDVARAIRSGAIPRPANPVAAYKAFFTPMWRHNLNHTLQHGGPSPLLQEMSHAGGVRSVPAFLGSLALGHLIGQGVGQAYDDGGLGAFSKTSADDDEASAPRAQSIAVKHPSKGSAIYSQIAARVRAKFPNYGKNKERSMNTSTISKEAAVRQMSIYLGGLANRVSPRDPTTKAAAMSKIAQLIEALNDTGNLVEAIAKVYPEKNASQRTMLFSRLTTGFLKKRAAAIREALGKSSSGQGSTMHPSGSLMSATGPCSTNVKM
jgi:hypothetical protein